MIHNNCIVKSFLYGGLCLLALGCDQGTPANPGAASTTARSGPDTAARPVATKEPADRTDTAVNARDRDSTTKTPMDQSEKEADIKTTADIRKRIRETDLSVDADNVKIITQDGKVTLRGPVKSDVEKKKIEEIALAVAGEKNVDSQLEVTK